MKIKQEKFIELLTSKKVFICGSFFSYEDKCVADIKRATKKAIDTRRFRFSDDYAVHYRKGKKKLNCSDDRNTYFVPQGEDKKRFSHQSFELNGMLFFYEKMKMNSVDCDNYLNYNYEFTIYATKIN